ncbi:DUF3820 family protein, partial [Vibrio sp. Vb2880]
LLAFGFFVIALLYNGGVAIEDRYREYNKNQVENESKRSIVLESPPINIHGFLVRTHSDAERVHNLEKLSVRFGKHEGKTWAEVPTEYLTWMVHEDHKYLQIARVILAARQSNYKFV